MGGEEEVCSLCCGTLDTADCQLSALAATAWSQLLSATGPAGLGKDYRYPLSRIQIRMDPYIDAESQHP